MKEIIATSSSYIADPKIKVPPSKAQFTDQIQRKKKMFCVSTLSQT